MTSPALTAYDRHDEIGSPLSFGPISAPVTAMTVSSLISSSGPRYVISSDASPSGLPTSRLPSRYEALSMAPDGGIPAAYSPMRPSSWTVVCRPGVLTSSAIQAPLQARRESAGIVMPATRDELRVSGPVGERLVLDRGPDAVELGPVDGSIADDVARTEEPVAVAEVRQPARRVEERRRAHAEQLVAARAADRIDRRKGAAPREGELGRVGAGPHVLGDLDLAVGCHELVVPGQAGDEADHRHEERGPEDGVPERLRRVEAVELGRELDVGEIGRLMPIAEPLDDLVRPRVIPEDRHVDDPGLQVEVRGVADLGLQLAQALLERARMQLVGVEPDEVRRVRGADVQDPVEPLLLEPAADGERAHVDADAHAFRELDEHPFVAAVAVPRFGLLSGCHELRSSSSLPCISGEGDLYGDERAAAGRAVDPDPALDGRDPVLE